jgi:protoporphyrinogen oxidase
MNKNNFDKTTVIAGAGMTGLMSALKLKQLQPDRSILLFDRSTHVGGLYGSLSYSEDICFDNGMHVIYESCNSEVDDLYRVVMPESEWNIYEGNEKDIAGLFFRGRLQTYSHYVDLRSFPQGMRESFEDSIFKNHEPPQVEGPKTAMDFLRSQFGKNLSEVVHRPILKMIYGVDPEKLDIFAIKATSLDRVILFDELKMLDIMKSSTLRARLAFPDQLSLPVLREKNQKALYPKKFGMSNFINRLQVYLELNGVEILTQTDITEISFHNGKVSNVTLTGKKLPSRTISVDKMLWTAGWPSLARQIEVDITDLEFQKGPEIIYVNLIFDRPLAMDRLYYFYCYDEGFASFRVTNYANYCPAAAQEGKYPICVELWPSKIGREKNDFGVDEAVQLAIYELKKFGVIDSEHNIIFSEVQKNVGGFPMPTLENTKSLNMVRTRVLERKISNILVAGVMAEDGLFFMPDILNDTFNKIQDF